MSQTKIKYSDLEELLKNDNKVKVAGVDVDGIVRGKYVSKKKFLSAAKPDSDFGFCSVIFGWDMHDQVYPTELLVSNKANGYRDLSAKIDLDTYRRIPWEDNLPFFLIRYFNADGSALAVCPRNLLRSVTSKVEAQLGLLCMAGAEFEYFQFAETAQTLDDKRFVKLNALTPGNHGYSMLRTSLNKDYFLQLFDAAEAFGIDVEGHHTETGPGVYETALAYTEVTRMADMAVLYKLLAKSIGMQHGITPTFMAKPWANLAGCSGHIHVSLRDASTGKNVFGLSAEQIAAGGRADAEYDDVKYLSEIGEQFLAGLMTGLPDIMPLLCPTINSYKRLTTGEAYWAPNICSYGYDSRLASVRILGPPDVPDYGTRFEVRVPGADLNAPYAFAAVFALGLYGIQNKLKLPFAPMDASRSVKEQKLVYLPTSLEAATHRFMHAHSLARKVLGDTLVDHFGGTRLHEVSLFNQTVTNWEMERYMELI
ncbi:putative glutamine synthetase [Mycosarcoma maydis]|uniref:Glutamine synthetase n=1 Tax=Mycosarcoma maydis TaxID=5270 RepID=A0A0D1DP50_MYCMD|nr:putative glutamine synthetase [Ustilago maydis 521]KIS66234.1 putative glutamine synthetase [Ustilago maydis 521]|eukprot:XP_011392295.1 putative glutamine synthetase [Ustilago maydis 521]